LAKAAVATFSIAPFLLGNYVDYVGLSTRQASQVLSVKIFPLQSLMYALHCSGAGYDCRRSDDQRSHYFQRPGMKDDILIVGAGIIGTYCAVQIAARLSNARN
jgi:hypothetical protein